MKRTRRSSSPRAIRLIIFALCYSLIVTSVFLPLSPSASGASSSPTVAQPLGIFSAPGRLLGALITFLQGGGPPNVPGPNLPDLDVMRAVPFSDPVAPAPIVSIQACTDCTPCPTCGPGGANHAPVVQTRGPYFGEVGTSIVVNGLNSYDVDPGDGITDYTWNFGDGSAVVHGAMPEHTYQLSGNRTISLTVKDRNNANSTATTTVSVTAGPPTMPPYGVTQGNGAQFIGQSVPSSMTAGQSYPVSVTMLNTGTVTWSREHLFRLGSQSPKDNTNWGTARVYLPNNVTPGASVTFNFSVVAPFSGVQGLSPVPFRWRMVEDGVAWFGEYTTEQSVSVISNYPSSEEGAPLAEPFPDLFASRIAVQHRTGEPGEDLISGNYNWGLGLVNLAGRAGLNLNLGLSYNSLAAWTRVNQAQMDPKSPQAASFTFDTDRGFPSVGFRMGFPTIQGPFLNGQTGGSAYLMLLPSGGRVELRQVGATNVYEAADSSYSQLLDGGNGSLLLRTTDGSQLAYWSINNEYRCTEVKDRNGNYLTIKYDPINGTANLGRMTAIVDTLGRMLDFNYDSNNRLLSISQPRNGQTPHVWATFGYTDKPIETNFVDSIAREGEVEHLGELPAESSEPTVLGLPEDNVVSVLTQVGLDDGSLYKFDYTSWGQVYRIRHLAADGQTELNYTLYNLPLDSSAAQVDCPRFSQRQDGAESWNDNNEVISNFTIDPNGTWGQVTTAAGDTAHQVTYKEYFTTDYTDWRRGLVTRTEIYTPDSGAPQKTTITDWTQDNTSVAYPLNPRPTATTISDAEGKRRRTAIEYTQFGLPSDVYEMGPYDSHDWRTLRRTHTDYNLSEAYVNRRIIGLVSGQYLFAPDAPDSESAQTLMAKTTQEYDVDIGFCGAENCVNSSGQQHQSTEPNAPPGSNLVVQHDANYGQSFVVGRGDLTRVTRWDVNNEMMGGLLPPSILKYNTSGSVVVTGDPAGHWTWISYADSFSNDGVIDSSVPSLTMAYPTRVTDPDGFSASAKYNYDLGAVTRQQDPKGAAQTTQYDAAGRVKLITNTVNAAYTKFVYPTSQTIVNKFTTIQEGKGEAYSATVLDGAGRVRAVAGDFPYDPSTPESTPARGHYSGQFTRYDIMGRAIQQTNPTEMTNTWEARGDDLAGWISTSQTYDWKGRPLKTTNPSIAGNPNATTTKTASYEGCGCAGEEVVTLTDEGTLVDIDPGPAVQNVEKKRQQKVYSDVLGRTVKTEKLNWDGAGSFGTDGSVYSSVTNVYNARDQVTSVKQYAGAAVTDGSCPSGSCQQTTMTYDGYGRLKTRHTPEQKADPGNSASSDHNTWDYNPDDTVSSVVDARGASRTLSYNARHLVTGVSYSGPVGIPIAVEVGFSYDAAGNRTSMNDGLGSVSYTYDQLSRMTSESRSFAGLGAYMLSYGYNLAGQLTKITDATNTTINYAYDSVGRVSAITGSDHLVGGITDYASGLQYRAWGALKQVSAGPSHTSSIGYNSRMQANHFDVSGGVANQNYDYFPDGSLSFVHNTTDNNFDRTFNYDHVGRLTAAAAGGAARHDSGVVPMNETFQYTPWNDTSQRSTESWLNDFSDSGSYLNGRRTGWGYDADGRIASINTRSYAYDAAGRNVTLAGQRATISGDLPTTTDYGFDGDGNKIRESSSSNGSVTTIYYLRSSVLGAIVEELNSSGQERFGYVYTPGGGLLARQVPGLDYVSLKQLTPIGATEYQFFMSNTVTGLNSHTEFDPVGAPVALSSHSFGHIGDPGTVPEGGIPSDSQFASISYPAASCTLDGVWVPCSLAYRGLESGAARLCPSGDCSPRRVDIDVRYTGGRTDHHQGLVDAFLLPDGFSQTWTGGAARWAYLGFLAGSMVDYQTAVVSSVASALQYDALDGRRIPYANYFTEPQKPVPAPGPDPTAHFGMNDFHWRNFMRGYNVALNALNDPDCVRAISELAGDITYSAKSVLEEIFKRHGFSYGGASKNIARTFYLGWGVHSTISLYDKFFDPSEGQSHRDISDFGYGELLARTILHELAHALGADHPGENGGKGLTTADYNDKIIDGCFRKKT